MIKGTHNSLTGDKTQGHFQWLLNPFTKCQSKSVIDQYNDGVRLFDIQIALKDVHWVGSHGLVWYKESPIVTLTDLDYIAEYSNTKIYIMLGLDNRIFGNNTSKEDFTKFVDHVTTTFTNLILVRAYTEKPWNIFYELKEESHNIFEKYWSLGWAKSMKKHWWQFYYYLPIPKLWKRIYGKKWDEEAVKSDKKFYITDFV